MPFQSSKIIARGNTYPVQAGEPFIDTVAQHAKAAGLSVFRVDMTDARGHKTAVDLHAPPATIPANTTITVTPYDEAGR